jgi:hypothetical protein
MREVIFDPVFVKEKKILLRRASEERARELWQNPQLAPVPLGDGSCLRRTGHPFTVSDPCGPSQKIECVFTCSLPVLKQSGESLGSLISVAQSATAGPGSLRAV